MRHTTLILILESDPTHCAFQQSAQYLMVVRSCIPPVTLVRSYIPPVNSVYTTWRSDRPCHQSIYTTWWSDCTFHQSIYTTWWSDCTFHQSIYTTWWSDRTFQQSIYTTWWSDRAFHQSTQYHMLVNTVSHDGQIVHSTSQLSIYHTVVRSYQLKYRIMVRQKACGNVTIRGGA